MDTLLDDDTNLKALKENLISWLSYIRKFQSWGSITCQP